MNDRLIISLIATALCHGPVRAEDPSPDKFNASIMDGNTIIGELLDIDAETGTTRMAFEHAKNPINLKTESVLSLKRTVKSKPLKNSDLPADLLLLRNGDRLPAKVHKINHKDGVSIETNYSGNYTIPVDAVRRISYGLASSPIFSGPQKDQNWVFLPEEDPEIEIKDGSITIDSTGSAAVDAGLTECSMIDLIMPTSQGRYISFALGSDALEPSDENDPDSPPKILASNSSSSYYTGKAYLVRISSRTLSLQGATMTPEGRVKYADLGIRFALPASGISRQISIGFNRRDKVIAFWVDGEYLGKYLEVGDWIGTGSAIVLGAASSRSTLTVNDITVREWHGVISDGFAAQGMQGKDVITLNTGERFTGNLITKDASEVSFETSLSNMTFPTTDVATIDFGSDEEDIDNEAAELETNEEEVDEETIDETIPVVQFGGIYRLEGEAFNLDKEQLHFTNPLLGNITLPFSSIDSIKFR